jgi:diguanylate cyclase (GGDEF)-like protein
VGRFGGEEFVVLLPDLPHGGDANADVAAIAERIRRRIASLMISVATPDGPCSIRHLTVSVGGALYPDEGGSVQQLIAAADTAVYAAKRDGRNRVRMASTLPTMLPRTHPATQPSHIPTARRATP